jgi:hypothetical protein
MADVKMDDVRVGNGRGECFVSGSRAKESKLVGDQDIASKRMWVVLVVDD